MIELKFELMPNLGKNLAFIDLPKVNIKDLAKHHTDPLEAINVKVAKSKVRIYQLELRE